MRSLSQTILQCPLGRYVWWPALMLVEFIEPGKRKGFILDQVMRKPTLEEALKISVKDLYVRTRTVDIASVKSKA